MVLHARHNQSTETEQQQLEEELSSISQPTMTIPNVTNKGNQEDGKDANNVTADPSKSSRRFNPYDGMDPNDPNYVKIPPEEFQEMMRKKKSMGIPSLDVLKEKTKSFNSQPDASVLQNEKKEEALDESKEIEKKEESTPPPVTVIPSKWKKFLKMQKARVPNEAILQLAKVQQKTPTKADVSELRELLGMEVLEDDEIDGQGPADEKDHENTPAGYPPRPPPPYFQKFLKMQKSGIPKQAILRSAKLQGHDCSKLERWLDEGSSSSPIHATPAPTGQDSPLPSSPEFQKFLSMKKQGIPIEAILNSARIQGVDCVKLEEWLKNTQKVEENGNESKVTIENYNQDKDDSRGKDRSRFVRYIKMREKGISVAFVLEAARNQFVKASEIPQLEKILAEVQPTKSTRAIIAGYNTATPNAARVASGSNTNLAPQREIQEERFNDWFTPIQKTEDKKSGDEDDEDEEDDEQVAFHCERTSPLASLVRKMAHTVDKTRRTSGQKRRNKKGAGSNLAKEDLVVNSKTLYHALGSFKGVQIARDNYNETLVATRKTNKMAPDIGWIRAKRQSFREIAKSIGVKLNTSNTSHSKDDLPTMANIEGLDALVRYIEDRYSDNIRESMSLLREDKLYDFDSLSALYVPGSKVVAKNICSGGIDMICKVAWNRIKSGKTITGQTSTHFEVCFEFVVAVGSNQATIAEVVEGIQNFEGRRNIFSSTGLTFIPLIAYDEEEQELLLGKYRRRGRIYNEVALNHGPTEDDDNQSPKERLTFSYKAYRKGCFFVKRGGFGGTVNASSASRGMATGGRIVIDSQGAYEYGNSLGVGYDPMITGIHYKLKEYRLHQSRSASDQQLNGSRSKTNQIVDAAGNVYSSSAQQKNRRNSVIREEDDDNGMVLFDVIPDDFLELVWPCVIGFSLTAKAWGDCLVDGLQDISFSEDVFDRLVLPEDRKRLIQALVKHSSPKHEGPNKHNFQDLIKGKGEGTVFLLYGPPGVGKTLTAEAVSEVLQRPLYSLSMGTLGTTADDLERRLTEILKLSAKWNAIILLDEADSFLEKRSSTSSLERNAMVSVMLQLVEYFTGILFLTSNRMDSLDPAFQTRITLSLPYHDLTEEGRRKIWENLLHKSGVASGRKEANDTTCVIDTRELAKHKLNGREIKNALRMALALASEEDCPLSVELLMETASMVKPISAFGKTYESNPSPSVVEATKPSIFWHFFIPSLFFLLLMLQVGVLSLMVFQNVIEGSEIVDLPSRSFLDRLKK